MIEIMSGSFVLVSRSGGHYITIAERELRLPKHEGEFTVYCKGHSTFPIEGEWQTEPRHKMDPHIHIIFPGENWSPPTEVIDWLIKTIEAEIRIVEAAMS